MKTKERIGDVMVAVDVNAHSAVVEFDDILESCELIPDDCHGAPWKEHDGWEHELKECDSDDVHNAAGYVRQNRGNYVVEITGEWGNYEYFRAHGASKQVARELTAQIIRKAKEQIASWYSDGWEWWGVSCEFNGIHDSLWGFLGYDDASDYGRDTVASQVAHELRAAGYTVVGEPIQPRRHLLGVNLFNLTR